MKAKNFADSEGKEINFMRDDDGKIWNAQYGEERLCWGCSADYIISKKTMTELKDILKQAGSSLTGDDEWELYRFFNDCLGGFKSGLFCFVGVIENQRALQDLIKAFVGLGFDGQQTLIDFFLKEANISPSRFVDATDFLQAARGLAINEPGGKRNIGMEIKLMLARYAWDLFEKMGCKRAVTNTGHLAQFISVLWNDPALGVLRGSPTDMRDYLREIKKDRDPSAPEMNGDQDVF